MSDLNPAEDDQTTEVGLPHPRAKRRSSILKTRQSLSDLGSCDNDATEHVPNKKSRRVSFSNKPEVREIPKVNYREPVLESEAEATAAKESVDSSSALAVTSSSATSDGENRSDFMASLQSLLLPPKMFNNQFGVYQLTDESDFKTLLNTNQNKVVAVCRASLMGNETRVFANDAIDMTNCHGNISVRTPSAEEGLTRMNVVSDIGNEGRKADCTLAQSFNKTKVFGDVSMEMTRCYDGLEGSFAEESCFDQTMLACRSDEDLELDNDDEGKLGVAAPGRCTLESEYTIRCHLNGDVISGRNAMPTSTSLREGLIDTNSFLSTLEFGHCRSTNKVVEDGKMPFELKSDAPRTAEITSAVGQGTDEMLKNSGVTSASVGLLQQRELELERNPNRTLLMGDGEGDMEMTVCLSKTITDGGMTFNRTVVLEEGEVGMEMATHFSKTIKDGERSSSPTVLLGEDDSGMEMTECFSKTIKDGGRSFNETLILEEDQNTMGRTDSLSQMLKDDGKNFIPTIQSGEHGDGLVVTNCVSDTCKELDTNRTVFLSDSEDKMEMTDCVTKTMKLDATVLPPRDSNTQNLMALGAGVNRTTSGDDSRNEMSFTECLGNIANNQATFLLQNNMDRTRIFTMEGNGEDIEQTECVRANVLQNATQTSSNWDLMETRVFSESAIDVLDWNSILTTGKVKQSSMSQEVPERTPLLDINAFLSTYAHAGNSPISRHIGEMAHVLEQKKGTSTDAEIASEAVEPTVFEALATDVPKAHVCQTPVVKSSTMMKAVNNRTAPEESEMMAFSARSTGVMRKQPRVMYPENLVAMVTKAAPSTGLNSSSCATHSSFAQDLSLASMGLATNRLESGYGARLGDQVHREVVISPETPVVLSSVSGVVSANLTTDSSLQHPDNDNVKSLGDITNLPWYANPRTPLSEAMEEEDMDVDVTVNLTQVVSDINRSKNRSANEQITFVLQEDKSRFLPINRIDRPENSISLTRNLVCAGDRWKFGMSLHTSKTPSDVDKSVSERVCYELRESRERSLSTSRVDHHERNSLHTGISSQADDRLTFGMNELKRGMNKSVSEQGLVEIHKDRSRHVSLGQVDELGKSWSTGQSSSNVADRWKLGISLPVTANKSLAFEGTGKRKRCVDVSEEFFEKEPKRRGMSDGIMFGGGADSVEAASRGTGQYREWTSKPRNVAQEMASPLRMHVADGRAFPWEQFNEHLDFDSRTHRLPRPSLPTSTTFANTTPILSRKELTSCSKLKDSVFLVSPNPRDMMTASVLFERSRHLNRLDTIDFENISRRKLLDMISLDQSAFLEEPATVAVESMSDLSLVRNVPMFDSDDENVERTQNRTDLRITSAFNLSKFELPEKWNRSTLDCSEMQFPLLKTADDLLPTVAPAVNSNDKGKPENRACVPVVTDAEDIMKQENGQEITSADVIDASQTNLGSTNEVEPSQNNLGSTNEIEPSQNNLGSTNEVEPSQNNLGIANNDEDPCVLLPRDPTQMDTDEVTDQQVELRDIVCEPQKSQMSVAAMAEEPKTLQSQDKDDLTSSNIIGECLSERPENLEKRSTTQNSVQRRLPASKRPRVAVEEPIVFANEELRRIDEEVKQILRVKDELMKSLIVSLTVALNQIPQIKATDKFSVWDLHEWKSSGCSFSFLSETLVLDVRFGSEVTGAMFCGRPAREISTLTIKSYPGKNMWPECELSHRLILELFDESVLRLYRDTSQLDKVLHHVLLWILKAEQVKKDITDLDPLHIRCRVEIEGHRVTISYSSVKAHVAFTVACDVHLPQQLDTCPAWSFTCDIGHICEEDVLGEIKQVKPGFHYLGNVYRRIQTWLDTLTPRNSPSRCLSNPDQTVEQGLVHK